MALLTDILTRSISGQKSLALLLDPEKARLDAISLRGSATPDFLFVGGSTGDFASTDAFVRRLHGQTSIPIFLFPGSAIQFTPEADALLFLSLLSGRNPDTLVGQQIQAARAVRQSGIEAIPMGYILVDGGTTTSVMQVSGTYPIPISDSEQIIDTAIAAELLGKRLIYLEAGSGAICPIPFPLIREVKAHTSVPLIVGGGIRSCRQMLDAFDAGADIVVIGNHFESHPEQLAEFCLELARYNTATMH